MNRRELVTILCEPALEQKILDLLREAGASGFSISRAEGDPAQGFLMEVVEGANVRIESVVQADTAERIVGEIERRFLRHRSLVVWQTEVRVVRPERFR